SRKPFLPETEVDPTDVVGLDEPPHGTAINFGQETLRPVVEPMWSRPWVDEVGWAPDRSVLPALVCGHQVPEPVRIDFHIIVQESYYLVARFSDCTVASVAEPLAGLGDIAEAAAES